jgi:hypothetical protein
MQGPHWTVTRHTGTLRGALAVAGALSGTVGGEFVEAAREAFMQCFNVFHRYQCGDGSRSRGLVWRRLGRRDTDTRAAGVTPDEGVVVAASDRGR